MKKFLFFFLLLMGTFVTQAYDFSAVAPTGQTLYYKIISQNNPSTVEVTCPNSSGYESGYNGFSKPSGILTIPSSVTNSGKTYYVKSIGSYAFWRCTGLTSVTIPNTVTVINDYAFEWCTGITELNIGSSVTTIGAGAFSTVGLTTIIIPSSVTSISFYAFYIVRNIVYNGTATGAPWGALCLNGYVEGELVYSNSSKTRLVGCSLSATSVTIPNSVTSIGESAFNCCSSLTSMTIPRSVTSIKSNAFLDCSSLKTVYNLSNIAITKGTTSNGYVAYYAKRVIKPTKSGDGDNAIYQIADSYSFVDAEDGVETHIPRATIPNIDNLIYKDGTTWKSKKVVLTDGQDAFEAPMEFTADSTIYVREFTNGNRSTLYLPFSAAVPSGFEVYDFAGYANNTISFTEHEGDIAAYTPYLVGYDLAKDGSSTPCTIKAANAVFPKSETDSYNPVTYNGLTFQGAIERTQMSTDNYGYSNGYFVRSGGNAHVNPFRCYFTVSGSSPASTLSIDILEGEVGIDAVEDQESPILYSNDVYDMMGRLVRRNADNLRGLPQGIYIWKGEKVFAY